MLPRHTLPADLSVAGPSGPSRVHMPFPPRVCVCVPLVPCKARKCPGWAHIAFCALRALEGLRIGHKGPAGVEACPPRAAMPFPHCSIQIRNTSPALLLICNRAVIIRPGVSDGRRVAQVEMQENTQDLLLRLFKVSQINEAHSRSLEERAYEKGYREALATVWIQFFPGTDIAQQSRVRAELDGDAEYARMVRKGRIPKC